MAHERTFAGVVLPARQGAHRYEVRVGAGAAGALPALAARFDRIALVSAAPVLRSPAAAEAAGIAAATGKVAAEIRLPDGERGKTLATLERTASALLAAGCTRRSLVVAVGGGAVSDAAGFLAATFMRGVSWVAVPTTLLSMVDAAIGGKTGVNLPRAKNAVGAFHSPAAVLADPRTLETLPERERRSGLGEVLKYAALEPALLGKVAALEGALPGTDLVAKCAAAKVAVVEEDPFEQGARKLLNLGHTFGHGVEAAGGFRRYTHGEAVAVGLAFAFRLAARLDRLGPLAVAEVEDAIRACGLPVRVPAAIARRAQALMGFDKKRTAQGLRWVLPRAEGTAWKVEWDVAAADGAVEDVVGEISEAASTPARRRGNVGPKRRTRP
jgi:3-dehydroquinate synthetase